MYLKAYLSVNRKLLSPGHRTNYTETRRVVGGMKVGVAGGHGPNTFVK